jgi:hypothetical protein
MRPTQRCLSITKGAQRFVFRYAEGCEAELLSSFVSLANDPACDFDWFDAAVLSYQMGQQLATECGPLAQVEQR